MTALSHPPAWAMRGMIGCAMALTAIGLTAIASAVYDPALPLGLGREAVAQLQWAALALIAGLIAARVPFAVYASAGVPAYAVAVVLIAGMAVLAALQSPLVPRIKGQANWLVLGPVRVQPVEFVKLLLLLAMAGFCAWPGFSAARLLHVAVAAAMALLPIALIAREDLGSALTLLPMVAAILVAAGTRWWMLLLGVVLAAAVVAGGVATLPREGPKSYQWRRIDAWLDPERYQAAEAFQAERSLRSIGNGGWTGQGFAQGDQNRLGWVPEKHTDMISSVIGEEGGYVAMQTVILLFLGLGLCALALAAAVPLPGARLVLAGGAGLLIGQMAINLMVATRMMPVTGVTLPLISYGGSSLLASWLLLGLMASAARARGGGAP